MLLNYRNMAENVVYPFPMVDIEKETEEEKEEEERGLLNRLQGRWVQIANGTEKKLFVRKTISATYLNKMRGNAIHSNIMLYGVLFLQFLGLNVGANLSAGGVGGFGGKVCKIN